MSVSKCAFVKLSSQDLILDCGAPLLNSLETVRWCGGKGEELRALVIAPQPGEVPPRVM